MDLIVLSVDLVRCRGDMSQALLHTNSACQTVKHTSIHYYLSDAYSMWG